LDEEEVYKMAAIMSSSGGLEAMLSRYLRLHSYSCFALLLSPLFERTFLLVLRNLPLHDVSVHNFDNFGKCA